MDSDGYGLGVVIAALIVFVKHGAAGIMYALFLAPLSWLYVLYAIVDKVFG